MNMARCMIWRDGCIVLCMFMKVTEFMLALRIQYFCSSFKIEASNSAFFCIALQDCLSVLLSKSTWRNDQNSY